MSRRQKYEYDITGRHSFLIDKNGELLETTKRIPIVRDYIESLPETSATFKIKQIDGLDDGHVHNVFMEFVGSWSLPENRSLKETRYVNPNYIHAHRYSDMVVECNCGAHIVHNYESDDSPVDNEHNHADSCKTFDRLRARADMLEKRYRTIKRLSWLGWRGIDMANRFGMSRSSIGSTARDFGLTLGDCYDSYRNSAAKTYQYLVHEKGVSAKRVGEIYGHDPNTIYRWGKKDLDGVTTPTETTIQFPQSG